jgi:hypothetical protein
VIEQLRAGCKTGTFSSKNLQVHLLNRSKTNLAGIALEMKGAGERQAQKPWINSSISSFTAAAIVETPRQVPALQLTKETRQS